MKTNEQKMRKRLLGISILFHAILVIIALSSFIIIHKDIPTEIEEPYNYMEINFTNNSTSSGMASTRKSIAKKPVEKPTARAIEKKVIKVEALEEKENDIKTENIEKTEEKATENEEKNISKTEGEGEEGKMLSGRALGELDFDGDGVFGRKVIYHAPIKKLAEQNGRIAINMGIDRAGKVVAVAYNKEYSTITDKNLIVRALKMATQYRFESDYTAPSIQYGRMTFIFDIKI